MTDTGGGTERVRTETITTIPSVPLECHTPFHPPIHDGTAFVITTHHNGYACAKECLLRVQHHAPRSRIWLFVNEGDGRTLQLHREFPHVTVTYVPDQSGGLTHTWNEGIRQALLAGAHTIALLNDDVRVNASIADLLLAASNAAHPAIYGPGTSHRGAPFNPESWVYRTPNTARGALALRWLKQWHGLNGFCIAFHARMVLSNMFDATNFFDPAIPFGGNETEWGRRWYLKGGACAVVDSCYVEHAKHRSWMALPSDTRKVKVKPPTESPKALIRPPPSHRVLLIAFAASGADLEAHRVFPRGRAEKYVALCGAPKVAGSARPHLREVAGWRCVHSGVERWTPRLRWKHALGFLKNAVKKRAFDKVIFAQEPTMLCSDLSFFVNGLGGGGLGVGMGETKGNTVGSGIMLGLAPHPDVPTLQAAASDIGATSDYVLERFEMPCESHPYFSEKLVVVDLTPASVAFLTTAYDKGAHIDWNLEFCLNWCAWKDKARVARVAPQWLEKLTPQQ